MASKLRDQQSHMELTVEQETIKRIESGFYRDCFIVANRKSTDEPENQKNSLKYQKAENLRYAEKQGLKIAPLTLKGFCLDGVMSERHSAFKEDDELIFDKVGTVRFRIERPKFYQLVQWLSKGYFRGAIHLCWDRASRNKADTAIMSKLFKMGVDMRFALTTYDQSSSGKLHMDIDGMFAEHHSRVTSEKVSLTIKNSRVSGLWTHKAPVGYLNPQSMETKPLDPKRARYILRFAELADEGWTLSQIATWATQQGFSMPPIRRRRTEDEILADEETDERKVVEKVSRLANVNAIHRILTNRFYTGKLLTKEGLWVKSRCHKAIIPEELFSRVQLKIRARNKTIRYAADLSLPLRKVIRCGNCARVYSPYTQKGIFYYQSRCQPGCPNPVKNFNFDFISERVSGALNGLWFTEEELSLLDARTGTEIALLESRRHRELEEGEARKRKVREDIAYLNTNRLELLKSGAYTPQAMVEEEARLHGDLSRLQSEEQTSDEAMREAVRSVVRLSELLKSVARLYKLAEPHEKDAIIREIFSELTVSGKTLSYKCKPGLRPLEQRFISLCDPKRWISELSAHRDSVSTSITSLTLIVQLAKAAEPPCPLSAQD